MTPALTPEFAGNTVIVMIIAYVITLVYSIYSLILNYRESKVRDLMKKNTQELVNIKYVLKDIKDISHKIEKLK